MINKKEQKVEDIFEEVDKMPVKKNQISSGEKVAKSSSKASVSSRIFSKNKLKRPMKVLFSFVAIIILGIVYVTISGFFIKDSNLVIDNNIIQNTSSVTDNNIGQTGVKEVPKLKVGPADTDGDGLSDEEETKLGTSLISSDTDNDGLFDREEVKIYKTNPKLKDTDGDGKDDGVEVANGYNPNGAGLLLDLHKSIDDL